MSNLAVGPDYNVRPYAQNMSNDSSPVSAADLKDVKKMADNVERKMWGIDIRYSISESMRLLDDIVAGNKQRQDHVEDQFQDVIENTTGKDVISAPEIIAARNGKPNLKRRIDDLEGETTAQLAQTTTPAPQKPTFVILDDDATVGVINTLEPILDSYGIKGNIAVITSKLDTGGWYMSSTEVKRLYDKGWNVLSHTHNHANLPEESENNIRSEMSQSKNVLENIGIEVNHIVYPGNKVDDKVARIAKDYYQSGLSAYNFSDDITSGINKSPIATYNLTRYGIGAWGSSDVERVKRIIDETIKINGLLIFMTHVGENTEEHNNQLREIIEYVLDKGYTFDTYEDAFEKHKNVIEQGDYRVDNNGYDFAVGKNGNMNMRGLRMRNLDTNAIDITTNPRFFGVNSDTYCDVTSANATGFPTESSGITHTLVYEGTHLYGIQFYKPHSSTDTYFRIISSLTSWGEWRKQSREMVERPLFNAPPSDYSIGTNTFTYPNDMVDVEGIPGGTLTTVRPSYTMGYSYQIHREYNSTNLFIRTQKGGENEWGTFKEVVTKPLYKKLPFDALASEYSTGTTVDNYSGPAVSGLGSPNERGGTLTTVKPSSSDLFYVYQIFKEHGENLLYYRSCVWTSENPRAWSDWKEL